MFFVRFILSSADTVNDFWSKNCHYMAGAIAFYALFAMFPLLLAIVYVIAPRDEQAQLDLARNISDVIPVSSTFVSETVQGMVSARLVTGIASFFGLLWAATAIFGAIRKGINAAWGIKKARPFLKERLIDFALVLGAGVVMLAVFFAATALEVVREVAVALAPESEIFNGSIWDSVPRLVSPVLSFVTFLILYRFLPNTDVRLKDVWPGALLASLAFNWANSGFVWSVKNFLDYNLVYGSVGAVLALLTWVYVSAIIVLLGAIFTSRYKAYVSSLEYENPSLKLVWTSFWRVRLRVVESTWAGEGL